MKKLITQDDIMNYYVDKNNSVWQMIGWCPEPTAVLMNLVTKEKIHLIPSCLNAQSYTKLVKEVEDENN